MGLIARSDRGPLVAKMPVCMSGVTTSPEGRNLGIEDAGSLFLLSVFPGPLSVWASTLSLSGIGVLKWKKKQDSTSHGDHFIEDGSFEKSKFYAVILTESVSRVAWTKARCCLLAKKRNCPHGNKQHFKMPGLLQGTWQISGPACNINGRISLGFVSRREGKWQERLVRGQNGSRWD